MDQPRNTTTGEWIGFALFGVGASGVLSSIKSANDAGGLTHPNLYLAFVAILLLACILVCVCHRRAEHYSSQGGQESGERTEIRFPKRRLRMPVSIWLAMLTAHTLFFAMYVWPSLWVQAGYVGASAAVLAWAHRGVVWINKRGAITE